MAAKHPANDPGLSPDVNNGIDFRGNVKYAMDLGTPDKIFTCASCHSGGIMAFDRDSGKRHDEVESWDNSTDGTGFFSKASYTDSEVDGDLFSYTADEESRGYIGMPHKFNWKKSGVLDTDCFLCHSDRTLAESENLVVKTANGWSAANPTPANPRVFVFVKKNQDGNVTEISMGFPPSLNSTELSENYTIDSAAFYSDPLERLVGLYYMKDVETCLGSNADNQTLQSIVISQLSEAIREGALYSKNYSIEIKNPADNSTICTLDNTNAPDLGNFTSTFFLDIGAPNFSARDYLRNAFYESTTEGQPYVGAGFYLRASSPQSNYSYNPMTDNDTTVPFVRLGRAGHFFGWAATGTLMAIADPNDQGKPIAFIRLKKQDDGTFKAVAYYAQDVDLDSVKLPILETSGHYTLVKPYSDTETDGTAVSHQGDKDRELSLMCAQCHFAVPDTENKWTADGLNFFPNWYVRRGIIGLGADVVKRGAVYAPQEGQGDYSVAPIAITSDGEIPQYENMTQAMQVMGSLSGLPVGYDVHMSMEEGGGKLSCLSCHGQDNLTEEEKEGHNPHNFLKGNDSAGEVMPALDYNPPVRTCISCHWGSESEAAKAHSGRFGKAAGTHISKIECQVCHIPYKTFWSFRFFDDTMGYSNQFDNRLMKVDMVNGTFYQFPPEWAIPAFGPTPTYGLNFSYVIAQTDDSGNDVVLPIFSIDMDPYRALMRVGNPVFGNWEIKPGLFPWRWAPPIIKRWTINDKGEPVLRAGLINPIQVFTWVDAATGRALFTREMNMAIDGIAYDSNGKPLGRSTVDPEEPGKSVPGLTMDMTDPNHPKVAFKIHWLDGNPGGLPDYIDDDNGDGIPEIDTDAEYEAMKAALKQVLDHEDPGHPHNPVIMAFTAPFGVDHGVLPAEYALGSKEEGPLSCNACHDSDESKNRLSPAVWSGDESAGRPVTLTASTLPEEAIRESKENHAWFLPDNVKTVEVTDPFGHTQKLFVTTQGALCRKTSVKVESEEFAAFYLVTPDGKVTGPDSEEVKVAVQPGTVDTPTAIKVEKVDNPDLEDSALSAARSAGIKTPVLATEIFDIHTKTDTFKEPVTFTVKYDPSKVAGKLVLLASEDGSSWNVISTLAVDPNNPYVTFARRELSYFAIVGEASSSIPTTGSSSAGGGGGCSIAPETAPASGIVSFLTMLSGIAGLFVGRRKKRN